MAKVSLFCGGSQSTHPAEQCALVTLLQLFFLCCGGTSSGRYTATGAANMFLLQMFSALRPLSGERQRKPNSRAHFPLLSSLSHGSLAHQGMTFYEISPLRVCGKTDSGEPFLLCRSSELIPFRPLFLAAGTGTRPRSGRSSSTRRSCPTWPRCATSAT